MKLSIKEMFNDMQCAGWIFYDQHRDLKHCWGQNSNDLGLVDDIPFDWEEDYTDRLIVESKIQIDAEFYIYVGMSDFNKSYKELPRNYICEFKKLVKFIKRCWNL